MDHCSGACQGKGCSHAGRIWWEGNKHVTEYRRKNMTKQYSITYARHKHVFLCVWSIFSLHAFGHITVPFQMTQVTIVQQPLQPQDRVEVAATQKSNPRYAHSTARWRTSPPATILLSSMDLPFKGTGYQTELFHYLKKNYLKRRRMKLKYLLCLPVNLFLHSFIHSFTFTPCTQVFVGTGGDSCWRGHGGEDQTSYRESNTI